MTNGVYSGSISLSQIDQCVVLQSTWLTIISSIHTASMYRIYLIVLFSYFTLSAYFVGHFWVSATVASLFFFSFSCSSPHSVMCQFFLLFRITIFYSVDIRYTPVYAIVCCTTHDTTSLSRAWQKTEYFSALFFSLLENRNSLASFSVWCVAIRALSTSARSVSFVEFIYLIWINVISMISCMPCSHLRYYSNRFT